MITRRILKYMTQQILVNLLEVIVRCDNVQIVTSSSITNEESSKSS